MSERPLEPRARLAVKHTTRASRAIVEELVSVVDMHTLEDVPSPERLELNDLGIVRLRLAEPLAVDPYERNRATGAFILIDEATNDTVGAGMVMDAHREPRRGRPVSRPRRDRLAGAAVQPDGDRTRSRSSRSSPAGGGCSRCSRSSSPSG